MPVSKRWLAVATAVCLAAIIGIALNLGAASAEPEPPNDENRPLEIQKLAVTSTPELLYVAVTPCRIVDTRIAVGAFAAGQSRNLYVGGTTGFAPQGGKSGGCGIPSGAEAVAAIVTAVSPSSSGYVRAWPAGTSEPTATLLNYASNSIGIGGQIKLASSGPGMTLKNLAGVTHIVIDVNGYYTQQMQAYISSSGTVLDQSGRLVSATRTGTGTYTLEWNRDISTCSGQGTSDLTGHIISVYTSGVYSYVYSVNNAGGAEDYWTNVLINC